jgi:PDZ domain-containing protein
VVSAAIAGSVAMTASSRSARSPRRPGLAGFRPATASKTTDAAAARAANVVKVEVRTLETIVTPEPDPSIVADPSDAEPKSGRRWLVVVVVAAALFVAFLIASALVYVPYYGISPGSASSAEARVQVKGASAYHDSGDVLFVTVTERHLTMLEWAFAWLDPDTDIRTEKQVLGTKTSEQDRKEQLQVMGFSTEIATYVAMKYLGYKVEVLDGGALISDFAPDVPIAKQLARNDVITAVDGTPIHLPSDITPVLANKKPGDTVKVTVRRAKDNQVQDVTVTLAKRDDGKAILGIFPGVPNTVRFRFPFTVDIGTGDIGGPSAGLAWTIATLDALTPGSITGGKKVAVTGTIDINGNVGAIGGLRQKTIAVIRAGADLFIVPKSEIAEAEKAATGSRLRVVGVETLDDALKVLASVGGNALSLPKQAAA